MEGVWAATAAGLADDAEGSVFILAVKSEPSADSSSEHSPFTGADNPDNFSPGESSNLQHVCVYALHTNSHESLHVGCYLFH